MKYDLYYGTKVYQTVRVLQASEILAVINNLQACLGKKPDQVLVRPSKTRRFKNR